MPVNSSEWESRTIIPKVKKPQELNHHIQYLNNVKRGTHNKFGFSAKNYDPKFYSNQNAGLVM